VLLLDEPLASLDPLARREFLHILVDAVRADGSTALLSSHVVTDIEQACDRLIVLGNGWKLLDASIADALERHAIGPIGAPIPAHATLTVDLNDGSYSTTKIYPIAGIPGSPNIDKAVGDFYVQFAGDLCAYRVPGGSFSMRFTGGSFTDFIPDGLGGQFMDGTFDLTVLEATAKFRRFVGGHNVMVDRLHALASGDFDEYCLCLVTRHERENDRGRRTPLDRAIRRA